MSGTEKRIAFYDRERQGILIPAELLRGSPFTAGDRFAVHPTPTELFALTLARDPQGEILCDRHGIFIARTRRIDILLGGIFDRYLVEIAPRRAGTIRLRPLALALDPEQSRRWYGRGRPSDG